MEINVVLCENEECEYNEVGDCEIVGSLKIDSNGNCKHFKYNFSEATELTGLTEDEKRNIFLKMIGKC